MTTSWRGPRTASSRITSSRAWRKFRLTILDRDGHHCQIRTAGICTGHATVVDKIIPAARRPDLAFKPSNCRAACEPCNNNKSHIEGAHGRQTWKLQPEQHPAYRRTP